MMGLGFPELMIILVIIMIIFGAGKLPEIGSAFGRSIKNFKTSMKDAEQEEIASGDAEGNIEGAEEPKEVPENTGETAEVSEAPESPESSKK
jgi:sec-independent protein translocase protein TatA